VNLLSIIIRIYCYETSAYVNRTRKFIALHVYRKSNSNRKRYNCIPFDEVRVSQIELVRDRINPTDVINKTQVRPPSLLIFFSFCFMLLL
jgi:hypothetical protein